MAGVGPQVVQVLDFATARAPELQALHELAHHSDVRSVDADAKLVSQKNQRRRRANAFKSHQMPRRLREPRAPEETAEEHIALGTRTKKEPVAKTTAARAKRDNTEPRCRKHRRRMHKLLDEHSWFKQDVNDDAATETAKWIPTHAWHAKRMRMGEQFGHVLAQRRQDKSVSAALAALRKTATLHDVSYMGVLELYGLDAAILVALQLVTDPSGSELDDATLFSGDREGHAVLHHANQFPSGAIAPVSFMWRPTNASTSDKDEETPRKRQLWLWIHPAAFMEAATAIASACREVMSERDDAESIDILDRRGHVARFELRGKCAGAMLGNVLRESCSPGTQEDEGEVSDHDDGFSKSGIRKATTTTNLSHLRIQLKKDCDESSLFTVRVQDPRGRSQPNDLPSGPTTSLLEEPTVAQLDAASTILCPLSGLSLTSGDAEEPDSVLILAQLESLLQWTTTKKTDTTPNGDLAYPYLPSTSLLVATEIENQQPDVVMEDAPLPCSELWSLTGRERVRQRFMKDHELNRIRGQDDTTDVPLMLVRQSTAFKRTGGWDLILSPAFAPAFLNALVFSGAMVIGLDEHEALATVAHVPSFPRDFPDTAAGREYWDALGDAQESEYAKKPKAKRVAYDKLGVSSPFQPNWELLFGLAEDQDPKTTEENDDDEAMEPGSTLCVLRSASYMEPFPFSRGLHDTNEDADESKELIPVAVPTLIRVALSFPRRAALEPCSMLYVPTAADLKGFHEDPKWSGRPYDGQELLGFVTSAVYDRPMGAFRGTAFCACEPLQKLALSQTKTARRSFLALTRTPTSSQLRPVMLRIQA